jgi:tetratricopeptide (TPR) repeat protein
MGEHGEPAVEAPDPADAVAAAAQAGTEAVSVALAKRRAGGKADARLDAVLEEQARFLRLQSEHLHEQRALVLSRLRWGRFSDRVKAALQVMTGLVGFFIVVALGAMAWSAHEDHGVSIAAFSVPPDLAQRGLTGQVLASQLLDRLAELQRKTVTARPASTYASDWGADIKVEIPETGVSIGELNRYLRDWLGSETRITGEVVRTSIGVAVTARAGEEPGQRFEGGEADLDRLVGQAAEGVYRQTQPYRWAVYLQSVGRTAEAASAYAQLAQGGAAEDRPWAYVGWGFLLLTQGDARGALEKAREAIRIAPDYSGGYLVALAANSVLGHPEDTLALMRQADRRLRGGERFMSPEGNIDLLLGDYRAWAAILAKDRDSSLTTEGRMGFYVPSMALAAAMVQNHDVSGARAVVASVDPTVAVRASITPWAVEANSRFELEDWAGAIRVVEAGSGSSCMAWGCAIAYAMLGRLDEARALADKSPLDSDDGLIVRGRVAAAARDWAAADRWFATASRHDPSIPLAPAAWGGALLAKGDFDGAIAKLAEAHRRGPHYADPLELWGEALMKKGDLAGAIGKFAAADPDAPRWGRNHLRWGEALLRSGRYAEARSQFEAANGMDLSRPDRAALDVFLNRTAKGPLHG